MPTLKRVTAILIIVLFSVQINAQFVQASKEEIIALTPEWKGERFPDGLISH